MAIYLTELSPETLTFPSPFTALDDPNGLLAFGGDLRLERIWAAYQQGIFPWYGPETRFCGGALPHVPCLTLLGFNLPKA